MTLLDAASIAWAAQLACLYEATAEKPGNVSPAAAFTDTSYADFVASSVAIGPAFAQAGRASVGETVLRAVSDTRRLVATNTNLGIVLLLAPLARAAADAQDSAALRVALAGVLATLSRADTRDVYAAIRIAGPAGMGEVEDHDVSEAEPDIPLRDAMALARERDTLAQEYCTDFAVTFGLGYPALRGHWAAGNRLSAAVTTAFLTILAEVPDTLVARKHGREAAETVSRGAAAVLERGGTDTAPGRDALRRFDAELRDPCHGRNPGTTADLVCASLFVFLAADGMIRRVPELSARW